MIVYHYTSIDTLEKILASAQGSEDAYLTLRGTHCVYLNDSTENVLGVILVKRFITKIEDELGIADGERLTHVAQTPDAYLATLLRRYDDHRNGPERFVISFSQDPDNLVMWSMYGNKGNGIALGLDTEKMAQLMTYENFFNIEEGVCTYLTPKQLIEASSESLPEAYAAIKARYQSITQPEVMKTMHKLYETESIPDGKMIMQQDQLMHLIKYASIFHKQDCWSNEHEYRLSYESMGVNIQYHKNSMGDYIPHCDVPIPLDALTTVMIGPATRVNAYGYVNNLLWKHKINNVRIIKSLLPLI